MTAPLPAKVPLKSIALPNEHGGWGFTTEPILLGLLVAPTWAGVGLSVFALAAFFTRHPLKLWLADIRRGKRFPRTPVAGRFALLYGSIGLAGLLLTLLTAREAFWWPLLLALPLIGVQLWYDAHNKGRNLVPEVCGAIAMGSVAAGIGLAGGIAPGLAIGLWLVLAMRSLAAIYYARAQVRRARGEGVALSAVYWAQALAIAILVGGALLKLNPWLSVAALALLLPLSLYTFARPPVAAKVVGWTQMAFGLIIVGLTTLGARMGW